MSLPIKPLLFKRVGVRLKSGATFRCLQPEMIPRSRLLRDFYRRSNEPRGRARRARHLKDIIDSELKFELLFEAPADGIVAALQLMGNNAHIR
jgi:hypothetical protein